MDGFENNSGVIVMAATNLEDTLDPALTRAGRFDRHVAVPLPDVRGRAEVLNHYLQACPWWPELLNAMDMALQANACLLFHTVIRAWRFARHLVAPLPAMQGCTEVLDHHLQAQLRILCTCS